MRLFRQLGTWGTTLLLAPIFWIIACIIGRALAQNAYDHQITASTRRFRLPELPVTAGSSAEGLPVQDRHALIELKKYIRIWSLEPGACDEFPDASRFPWSWNPLNGSATIMRLKQKQAFLTSQHHHVFRQWIADHQWRYVIQPDPEAALGGRRFYADVQDHSIQKAWEWK